jgi:hypothetical protein
VTVVSSYATPTVVAPFPLSLGREQVLHFLDYPVGHAPPERIERLLEQVLPEARALAEPRGAFVRVAASDAPALGLEPVDAAELALGLGTAGASIEARVSELSAAGDLTRAVLLDAAGSAAAEEVADRLGGLIAESVTAEPPDVLQRASAAREVPAVSCRLSPGYGKWKLEAQPALFARLPHAELGITLTPTLLMVPRKSISFAMWLGAREPIGFGLGGCAQCQLERCRYRRARAPRGPSSRRLSEGERA